MKGGNAKYFILFSTAIVLAALLDLMTGSVSLAPSDIFSYLSGGSNGQASHSTLGVIMQFRLLKMLAALMSGAALGCCGLLMQTLFRNPLADPYILGISSASGLGVSIFVLGSSALGLGAGTMFHSLGIAGSALAGAFALALLIIYVSRRLKDNLSLLIFGIMVGSVASAIITMLQYLSADSALKMYVLWTMGSFSGLSVQSIAALAVMLLAGLLLSVLSIKDLNTLLMGETYAQAIGLNTGRIKIKVLLAATFLAGGVTAFCGPIGFVGIAIPHVARFIFRNSNHRILLPASILLGAFVMLIVDMISTCPAGGVLIPVNTVAALMGIPVILAIILKNRK